MNNIRSHSVSCYNVLVRDVICLLCFQILTSCTLVLRRLWTRLLAQHPSPLMTEHGEGGLSACICPFERYISATARIIRVRPFMYLFVSLLPLKATRCLTGKQNQYPTSSTWHVCPTTGVVMANQPDCKSTTVSCHLKPYFNLKYYYETFFGWLWVLDTTTPVQYLDSLPWERVWPLLLRR